MRPVMLSQLAQWCEGRLIGDDVQIEAVSTDSRNIPANALFIALKGERFDAHEFAMQAKENGARALLVHRPVDSNLPQIHCSDTQEALGEIAAGMQRGRPAVVVAFTGSNGKTSVKNLVSAILQHAGRTYFNPGNRNNEIGLPLAVLDAPEDAQFAVYEMGAGQPGDIAYLASIVPPNVSLVNNIAPAHIERMGSLLGIAETKGAIYEALPDDGIAVVNSDDAFAPFFQQRIAHRRVLRFGIDNDADVSARDIRIGDESSDFVLQSPAGQAQIHLPLPGRHNVMNALAATALALGAGAPFAAIEKGLQSVQPVKGRQVTYTLSSGAVLIDDSYNANPGSVAAAIQTLAAAKADAWLVLGDMMELGDEAAALHAMVGEQAHKAGLKRLYTVGRLSENASRAFGNNAQHFLNQAELINALQRELHSGVRCLIKGSRSSAMDKVVAALIDNNNKMENGHAA
jgi:UDP-N-acetylmuramoyl-tripeptide--D-alanyl-D-alanine ligase